MTDKDFLEQFQLVLKAIGDVESRMATKEDLKDEINSLETRMNARFKEVDKRFSEVDERFKDIDIHFKGLERRMDSMEDSIISKIVTGDDIERIADRAAAKAIMVAENTFGKRIDAINDGFKGARDKQGELEHRVDKLEQDVEDIRNRIA